MGNFTFLTSPVKPAVNGYLSGLGSERRGSGSAFHQLWASESLLPLQILDYGKLNLFNISCEASSKWLLFSNQGRIRQQKRVMGSAFHQLCLRYCGPLTAIAPTAIRLWETLLFDVSCKTIKLLHLVNLLNKL